MSTTYADITITNLFIKSTTRVRALVDTGCMLSTVTDEVAQALGFDPAQFTMKRIVLADGRSVRVPTIGPIQIDYEDRSCKTEAYVMGDECLLGCVPLECMDLTIDPVQERLIGRHPGGPVHRVCSAFENNFWYIL
jgi:clan AA aspartic protease